MTGTYDQLVDIVRETFDLDEDFPITADTQAADVDGWDSLSHATLVVILERHFKITLPHGDVVAANNIGDLAALIDSRIRLVG